MASFENLVQSEAFLARGPIDLLCVTGDISNGAHAHEFRLADEVIGKIATSLGLHDDRIFFVPGNHDLHWPVMKLEPKEFWESMKYAPLLQEELRFKKILERAKVGAFHVDPFFTIWEEADIFVLAINSAAYDGPEEKNHSGIVKQSTLEKISNALAGRSIPSDKLKICLIHHHPIQYSEPSPDAIDLSIIVNSENLMRMLNGAKIDLILHGHKHHPRLNNQSSDNGHPAVVMGAGSFSAILQPLYYGGITNLFHVINIEGRSAATMGIEGTVQTWMFNPKEKWQPSNAHTGMPHEEAFGSSFTSNEIATAVRAIVSDVVARQGHCRVLDLTAENPHLLRVRRSALFNAMFDVSNSLGLKMLGDPQSSHEHWAIFR